MTEDARDKARRLAHEAAADVLKELVSTAKSRRPPRNAQARTAAARLVLEVAGLTGAAGQHDAIEQLCKRLEPLMSPGAYAELIGALAQLQGLPAEGTGQDGGGGPGQAAG